MRQFADPNGPPLASWVIGRDAALPGYTVLYTDDRGVSRVYEMSLAGDQWKIWRNDPDFSQRFEATLSPDRQSVAGRWEKRPSDRRVGTRLQYRLQPPMIESVRRNASAASEDWPGGRIGVGGARPLRRRRRRRGGDL